MSPYFASDFRDDTEALINVRFTTDNLDGVNFINKGRAGGSIVLSGTKQIEDVFFALPGAGSRVAGTLADDNHVFDGIACDDRHMTTQLNDEESYISFMTPPLQEWSNQNTIEFWFKIEDPSVYQRDVLLFSMVSAENNPQLYYHVYIQDGDLKCAPFGNKGSRDPVIVFR